jgi:hypothetical protein
MGIMPVKDNIVRPTGFHVHIDLAGIPADGGASQIVDPVSSPKTGRETGPESFDGKQIAPSGRSGTFLEALFGIQSYGSQIAVLDAAPEASDISAAAGEYGASDQFEFFNASLSLSAVGGADLIARNLTLSSTTWTDGDTITANWVIENLGDQSAADTASYIYISTDATITTSDILIGFDPGTGTLSPGGSSAESDSFLLLDLASLGLLPGTYYVGVLADPNNDIIEVVENNNTSNVIQVTITDGSAGNDPHHDFNGDGTSDILWRNDTTGQVGMYRMNNGDPTWQGISTVSLAWDIVGTGDFNGDGTDDILWRNTTTGQVGMYRMNNGVPTWQSINSATLNWQVSGTGDFNGDGTDDILWRHTTTGQVGMYRMNNGVATWQGIGTTSTVWEIAGTGDFNGDGTDDILWRNTTTGQVGMYRMNNGVPTWQSIGTTSLAWALVGTGDFNGDGTDDILWRNVTTGQVGMYRMNNGVGTWQGISTTSLAWDIVGTGDFNGDGTDDILWRNTTTGQVGMFAMNNGTPTWDVIGSAGLGWSIEGQDVDTFYFV